MHPMLARNVLNPVVFGFRREPVQRLRREIEAHQWLDAEVVVRQQITRVDQLVRSHERVNGAYARLLKEAGWSGEPLRSMDDLARLPVLGKQELADLAEAITLPRVALGRYTTRMTGGSTGEPAVVYAPPLTSASSLAARMVCQGWYHINPGDRQIRLWGRRLDSGRVRSALKDTVLNRIRLDSLALERGRLADTLDRIRHFGVEYLYGYASMIDLLATRIVESGISDPFPTAKAAISTSETLLPGQQARLQEILGCPVVNEYGCSEVDIITFQCPAGRQHVVASNVLVEVERFGDEPEGYGQILVTDLHNTLMPVIRYRLGDLARLEQGRCDCGRGWPCLVELLGRSQGQYVRTPDGRLVHSQFLVYVIEDLVHRGMAIGRFTIIQERDFSLTFKVAPRGDSMLRDGVIEDAIKKACAPTLGPGFQYRIIFATDDEFELERINKFRHFESRIEEPC